jgi:hypothetical protein
MKPNAMTFKGKLAKSKKEGFWNFAAKSSRIAE